MANISIFQRKSITAFIGLTMDHNWAPFSTRRHMLPIFFWVRGKSNQSVCVICKKLKYIFIHIVHNNSLMEMTDHIIPCDLPCNIKEPKKFYPQINMKNNQD